MMKRIDLRMTNIIAKSDRSVNGFGETSIWQILQEYKKMAKLFTKEQARTCFKDDNLRLEKALHRRFLRICH